MGDEMDDMELKRGFRNAWVLTLVAAVFLVVFLLFTVKMNTPDPAVTWKMGGTPFVPASAMSADGYHKPVPPVAAPMGDPSTAVLRQQGKPVPEKK
jgi:hypothetical protein